MARFILSAAVAVLVVLGSSLAQNSTHEEANPTTKQGSFLGSFLNKGENAGQQKHFNPQFFASLFRPIYSYLATVNPTNTVNTGATSLDYTDATGTGTGTVNSAPVVPNAFGLFNKDKTWLANLFGGFNNAVSSATGGNVMNPSYQTRPFARSHKQP